MRWKRWLLGGLGALTGAAAVFGWLFYRGILWFNNPWPGEYPVRGVDISHYQGEVDWPALAAQKVDFVFMKATEGSSYTDPCFAQNIAGAQQAGLRVGAYHFFSFDSAPETQAAHFIETVPQSLDLPPVVDLEFYGDKEKVPPDRDQVWQDLTALLELLQEHYGQRPLVYTTMDCYERYLKGQKGDFDLWIRNVLQRPALEEGESWTFWQYSHRGRLKGFEGEEPFIDLNVFCGSREEFLDYGGKCSDSGADL